MKKRVIRLTETDIKNIVRRVISEQTANVSSDVGTVMRELGSFNTDERKIVDIVKKYNDKTSFKNFLDQYKTISGQDFGLDIHRAVNTSQGDTNEVKAITDHLAKLGVGFKLVVKNGKSQYEISGLGSGGSGGGTTAYDLIKPILPDVLGVNYAGIPGSAKETYATSIVYHIIDPKTGAKRYNQFEKDNKTLTAKGDWKIQDNSIFYEPDDKTKEPPTDQVKGIGGVRVAPTEDFVKSGRAFVESTMSGELVRKIQQALINQGYLKISKATNYFGPKTDAAVKDFQKAKGLKVDGKVGVNTYNALFAPATLAEPERQFPEEITNIKPKGLANVTQGIQTPPQITRQGNIQTANY